WPNRREAATLGTSMLLLLAVLSLLPAVLAGGRPAAELWPLLPGLAIRFSVEPLGMLFACVAAVLWPINSLYSIGYMRGNREGHQTRFYVCFAIALSAALGVAFAGNLLTLFVFYEILTLSTYPLVAHKGTPEAMRGGRLYLGMLIGTSVGLLFPAMLWTWNAAGTLDFAPGGILAGRLEGPAVGLLLALYMFGIGKAALMPFHRWLPAAMVAPTPVSALLHAVAVVKAGVFTVMKVTVYIFGVDFLAETGASWWLAWVAAFTLLAASVVALTQDNLKARLAYSTVSQLAYVVLGAALANAMGVMGGAMQIAMHAFGKITLFFCAGAIYTAARRTEISQMDGLGRAMPLTYAAFLIGALSVAGLPPLGGTWSKWFLLLGAADAGQWLLMAVLTVSTLLNVGYLLAVPARGFFLPAADAPHAVREAPLLCVLPPCLTALGCVLLFFCADAMYALLKPLTTP
ncbi:MAG: monovalent cation/H+ antiporter subunit D family protein, partial [Pseudomonadota bacterium]|nr:monovalent cation/H+ antiporter subunit D family protein [Pseudomonadota bacterium]